MMYREVYYQERMEEELRKESNRMKLEELPNDLPTTTEAEADVKKCNESKSQAWGCMGISLAFIALAGMLLNGWLVDCNWWILNIYRIDNCCNGIG